MWRMWMCLFLYFIYMCVCFFHVSLSFNSVNELCSNIKNNWLPGVMQIWGSVCVHAYIKTALSAERAAAVYLSLQRTALHRGLYTLTLWSVLSDLILCVHKFRFYLLYIYIISIWFWSLVFLVWDKYSHSTYRKT